MKNQAAWLVVFCAALAGFSAVASAQPPSIPPDSTPPVLTLQVTSRMPDNKAKLVCPDTHLTLTFNRAPTLATSGNIRIYDAANDTLVDTLDVGLPLAQQNYTIGGEKNFHCYPALVSGNTVIIYPHNHALAYNKTYYVQMDAGILRADGGAFLGYGGKTDWVFSTKVAAPAEDSTRLVVAADGAGDFATVQGAVDFVPTNPKSRVTLFIRKGLYAEMVYFDKKSNITFLGEDRDQTIVGYPNNEHINIQPGTTEMPGTPAYHRGLFFANHSTGLQFVNLTLHNSTPKGGGQAEALILTGGQNIVSHVNLMSFQDTIQFNDSVYVTDTYIEGDTDFLWGRGPVFFEDCALKALTSGTQSMQIRNTDANHGFVYLKCKFDRAGPNVANVGLARINPTPGSTRTYPYSEVVLINCLLGPHVSPVAWQLNGATSAPNVHDWEYNSTNISDGQPVDVSRRAAFSKQLTMENDAATIANYSNPGFVLGWTPAMAPIILSQPAQDSSAQPTANPPASGTANLFSVVAVGVPAPTYQWRLNGVALKDGDNIQGATTDRLTVDNSATKAGNYTVVVANASGSVTSSVASLNVKKP